MTEKPDNEPNAIDAFKARFEREAEDVRREFAASINERRKRIPELEAEMIRLALEIRDESDSTIQ